MRTPDHHRASESSIGPGSSDPSLRARSGTHTWTPATWDPSCASQHQEHELSPVVRHIIVTVEKTDTSTESGVVLPLESTLEAMHDSSPSDCPTYRFKEWTSNERGGLEFTLTAIISPLPPSITFGEVDKACTNTQMIRRITAHQLWEKYQVVSPPPR